MKKGQIKSPLLLLLTATIWGVAFVAQSVGMDYVGPFTFNSVRSIIGGIVLIPCIFLLNKINGNEEDLSVEKKTKSSRSRAEERKKLMIGGIMCGIFLCVASNFQQMGIMYTSVGKAGFITACYIVLVPILGMFLGKKTRISIWLSVLMAVVGLYLLCMTDSIRMNKGDFLILVCAFFICLSYFSD